MVNPKMNQLLDQLPEVVFNRLAPHLRLVSLVAGDTIFAPGVQIEKIYFPISAAISITKVIRNGASINTAIIGSDGLIGIRALDRGVSQHHTHVIASGLAYQISRSQIQELSILGDEIYRLFLQASMQMIGKMSLEVACSNFHNIEQRLAKWILIRYDIGGAGLIKATHQGMADAMGVRREAITNACQKLGGIRYSRGFIEVIDHELLEKYCCECYLLHKDIRPLQMSLLT